jgi:hypothetical protein
MCCVSKAALLVHRFFSQTGIFREFFYISLISLGGEGGAQRPVSRVNEPKHTGARSASAAKTH